MRWFKLSATDPVSGREIVKVPTVIYHVTPYAEEIIKEHFKMDMPQTFSGSTQGGLSFTTLERAQNYAKGLKWMVKWKRGEVNLDPKNPNSIYAIAKDFGMDYIDVEQAVSIALNHGHFSSYPDELFKKDPAAEQRFMYWVLAQFPSLSKGRFPLVFSKGLENMNKSGKSEDDIKILKVTLPAQQEGHFIPQESEWRLTPEKLKDSKIEVVG